MIISIYKSPLQHEIPLFIVSPQQILFNLEFREWVMQNYLETHLQIRFIILLITLIDRLALSLFSLNQMKQIASTTGEVVAHLIIGQNG